VTYECDRQMEEQTNILISNATLHTLHGQKLAKKDISISYQLVL